MRPPADGCMHPSAGRRMRRPERQNGGARAQADLFGDASRSTATSPAVGGDSTGRCPTTSCSRFSQRAGRGARRASSAGAALYEVMALLGRARAPDAQPSRDASRVRDDLAGRCRRSSSRRRSRRVGPSATLLRAGSAEAVERLRRAGGRRHRGRRRRAWPAECARAGPHRRVPPLRHRRSCSAAARRSSRPLAATAIRARAARDADVLARVVYLRYVVDVAALAQEALELAREAVARGDVLRAPRRARPAAICSRRSTNACTSGSLCTASPTWRS